MRAEESWSSAARLSLDEFLIKRRPGTRTRTSHPAPT